jgi:pimeloyl-ACP methyl ester carboxylesterase
MARIRREFVDTPLGQVLVRTGGSGKPVFLLHNTYLGSESFERGGFLERAADRYQVYAPDAIGQTDSDQPPHALEIADYAANLGDVMTGLGVEKASFVGSHTGASIALELAVAQPERVDALVFAGLPLWTASQRDKVSQMDRFKAWDYRADGTHLTDLWQARAGGITHGLTPEQMHKQFLAFLRSGPRVHEPLLALFRYEPRDRLPLVKARVLAVAAEGDPFKEQIPEITAAIPSTETVILPPGTLLHAFDPDGLLAALTDFLG